MAHLEITTIAWFLLLLALLMGTSVLLSQASHRFGVPVFLLFLAVGMLAGSDGLGIVHFDDYQLSFRIGTVALALILFDGGLNTPRAAFRRALWPASSLATVGVVGTALVVAAGARLLGFPWASALLLGAIVSSTDAAAVFSVLRASGLQLRERVGATLEMESGLNDPMAVLLTLTLTESLATGEPLGPSFLFEVFWQLLVGTVLGLVLGRAGVFLLRWSRLPAGGLYPVFTLALALISFSIPTLLNGSGYLAVYLAGIVLGNSNLPYQTGLRRFHDSLAWLSQVGMFLVLGLLSFPAQIVQVAGPGLALGLLLSLVARPAMVLLCLAPFRFRLKEAFFIGWTGLRGAVPIILAIFPVLAGVPGAEVLFNIVFCVVVVSAILPGAAVAAMARLLKLGSEGPPHPPAVLEITSTLPLQDQTVSFYVDPALPVCGVSLAEIPFPPEAGAMLIVRGDEMLAARGDVVLEVGDHIYVFCRPEDRPLIDLLFGQAQE